jgi:hypothetical protein
VFESGQQTASLPTRRGPVGRRRFPTPTAQHWVGGSAGGLYRSQNRDCLRVVEEIVPNSAAATAETVDGRTHCRVAAGTAVVGFLYSRFLLVDGAETPRLGSVHGFHHGAFWAVFQHGPPS